MNPVRTTASIQYLYHFTDENNLASIRTYGGLFATALLQARGMPFMPAGNELSLRLDREHGMHQYVHLSFVPKHPLQHVAEKEGRIGKTVVLRISRSVLHLPGVMYCPGVANAKNACPVPIAEAASMIDYDALYAYIGDYREFEVGQRRRRAELSELLIPEFLPMTFIENLPNG